MSIPRKRLDDEVFNSGQWLPTWTIAKQFQITHALNTQGFIIDMSKDLVDVISGNWLEFLVGMLLLY